MHFVEFALGKFLIINDMFGLKNVKYKETVSRSEIQLCSDLINFIIANDDKLGTMNEADWSKVFELIRKFKANSPRIQTLYNVQPSEC